ncbi:ICMT-domain-containing protein [Thozetella sp. PMI_491]|nr:ICMT-domain-containing protein [Thozetella sp. PMI_491]
MTRTPPTTPPSSLVSASLSPVAPPASSTTPMLSAPAARAAAPGGQARRRSRGHLAAISSDGRVVRNPGTQATSHSGSEHGFSGLPPLHIRATDADLTLPLLSPAAMHASPAQSSDYVYFPHQPKSLAGIAVRAFCLGGAAAAGLLAAASILLFTASPAWRVPFFLAALALHHFLEFWSTAAYNTRAAEIGSFLLTANWPSYAIAHATATVECLLVSLVWPHRSWAPFHLGPVLLALGLGLVVVGQTARTAAMMQAGPSFNHIIQHRRHESHVLVTTGIYSKLRHPSYFGFFWWALGTQLVLGNAFSFVAYTAVLWRFFRVRIRHEEDVLIRFFGDEYVNYRKAVGTKIPLIP